MKDLVILGAGTGGTVLSNLLRRQLPDDWRVTVVDPSDTHLYQPGLLFLPFGGDDEEKNLRPREKTLGKGVEWRKQGVVAVEPETKTVKLEGGESMSYDLLVIATGVRRRPEMIDGLLGPRWNESIFNFYELEGARALRTKLETFEGGKVVVNFAELPITCPVAPMEWIFLAEAFFKGKGIRDRVELSYVIPIDKAFTKPVAAKELAGTFEEKGIEVVTDFAVMEVDDGSNTLVSYDDRRVDFDLLVQIPTNTGAEFIDTSGFGNELALVPTKKRTLEAEELPDVFVLGDATDLPTSKAGSVAHYQAELLAENLLRVIGGDAPEPSFDGHANCFIETGYGKAMLLDFNYELEPVPGKFPIPGVGPFALLRENRANHLGKLAFRWMYFNGLLPGKPMPVAPQMSMAGKDLSVLETPGA